MTIHVLNPYVIPFLKSKRKYDKSFNHYYFKMSNNKCWKQKRDQLLKATKTVAFKPSYIHSRGPTN